jgi:cytochrome c oxidase subunit 4
MAHASTRIYYVIFALLMILLAVTVAAAEVDLGRLNFLAAVMIATTKAVLILLFFMHLRDSTPLTWLISGGSLFFLAIMFAITLSDYLSRGWLGP